MSRRAIVVGGGCNGLVAAWRLADAGYAVTVCERSPRPGGQARAEELAPGFFTVGPLDDTRLWRRWLTRALDLEAFGLRLRAPAPIAIADPGGVVAEIDGGRLSGDDEVAYRSWHAFVDAVRPAVERLLDRPPPVLEVDGVVDALALLRDGWSVRRLGRRTMTELLRVGPMPAADWLRESFSADAVVEGLTLPAVIGSWLGPHSAGSAANLLALECRVGDEVVGGAPALVKSLLRACEHQTVDVRTSAEVAGIVLDGRGVRGVELVGGEQVEGEVVVATCDPKRTVALVPPVALPLTVTRQIENWRMRGTLARVSLALSRPMEIEGRELANVRLGSGSVDGLERAFDAVKYRRASPSPVLEVRQPSLQDPEFAPDGGAVLTAAVAYAPYQLEGGWDDGARAALEASVVDRLAEHDPGLRSHIVASQLLSPDDIESRYGTTGGQHHHGEHALDQLLFVRPSHRLAHYRTPLRGLFLGGSGSHPGGGLTGVPGWLAAGTVLDDRS